MQNLKRLLLRATGVVKIPREIGGLKNLEILEFYSSYCALPWEASQLSKLEGVPECIRQACKNSDLVSELAGEILSFKMVLPFNDRGANLIIGRKHMHIPQWLKDHFNNLAYLDIRICKLEEQDLKILREMPRLYQLMLRLEVVPRKPIAISGEGFPGLENLIVYSCTPRVITFQEGAMPMLGYLHFGVQFFGGPSSKDPLGIKHLRRVRAVVFRCNEVWYQRGAESNPCVISMIDVVRKEVQEHPNRIYLDVFNRAREDFPAKEGAQEVSSSGTGEIKEEIQEEA
ncbi:disease resistance protein Pikm1-TS-like [Aegilops tauschii subsp. strangulata]|uniref:disease resistance protein Pikm1-TS-like n=1 Tax=Aegilops tauschii subsp. strangulata TaxID=200361 RepID=UPI003CC8A2CB